MTIRNAIIAPLLALFAAGCFDSDDTCPASETLVNEHGVHAWATAEGWGAWARHADRADLEAAVEAGTLAPLPSQQGSECYALIADGPEPPALCVTQLDCVELLGRPVDELDLVPSGCSIAGQWDTFEVANALDVGVAPGCYALFNGYAVEVSDDPR